jgi:hypothetical protein
MTEGGGEAHDETGSRDENWTLLGDVAEQLAGKLLRRRQNDDGVLRRHIATRPSQTDQTALSPSQCTQLALLQECQTNPGSTEPRDTEP